MPVRVFGRVCACVSVHLRVCVCMRAGGAGFWPLCFCNVSMCVCVGGFVCHRACLRACVCVRVCVLCVCLCLCLCSPARIHVCFVRLCVSASMCGLVCLHSCVRVFVYGHYSQESHQQGAMSSNRSRVPSLLPGSSLPRRPFGPTLSPRSFRRQTGASDSRTGSARARSTAGGSASAALMKAHHPPIRHFLKKFMVLWFKKKTLDAHA